jgi:hypothetical protein
MKKAIAMNFRDLPDNELELTAMCIMQNMNDGEFFVDAGQLLKELNKLYKQFAKDRVASSYRDILKISIKNDTKKELIKKLKEVAEYVMAKAAAEEAPSKKELILIRSAFPLAQHTGKTVLENPKDFAVKPGSKPGEVVLQVTSVKGARSYMYQFTTDPLTPDSQWESVSGTRCRTVLHNLPLGQNCWFCIAAVGPNGQVVYSEKLSRYIS